MTDEKRERNPWNDRYDKDDTDAEPNTSETSEPSESSKTSQTAESAESSTASETVETSETSEESESEETSKSTGSTVRERKNVNMYLPDGLVSDMQLRYSELNVEWRREHDDDLPKNEVFYPAVIRAALEGTSIRAEIGLDEE